MAFKFGNFLKTIVGAVNPIAGAVISAIDAGKSGGSSSGGSTSGGTPTSISSVGSQGGQPTASNYYDPYASAAANISQQLDIFGLADELKKQGKYLAFNDAGQVIGVKSGTPDAENQQTKDVYSSAFSITKPYEMLQQNEIGITPEEKYLQNFFGTLMEAPTESEPLKTIPKEFDAQVNNAINTYLSGQGLPPNVAEAIRKAAMANIDRSYGVAKDVVGQEAEKRGYGASSEYGRQLRGVTEDRNRQVLDLESNIAQMEYDAAQKAKALGLEAAMNQQQAAAERTFNENQQQMERSRIDRTFKQANTQMASAVLSDIASKMRAEKERQQGTQERQYANKVNLDRADATRALTNLTNARFQNTGFNSSAYGTDMGQYQFAQGQQAQAMGGIGDLIGTLVGGMGSGQGSGPAPVTPTYTRGVLGNSLSSSAKSAVNRLVPAGTVSKPYTGNLGGLIRGTSKPTGTSSVWGQAIRS